MRSLLGFLVLCVFSGTSPVEAEEAIHGSRTLFFAVIEEGKVQKDNFVAVIFSVAGLNGKPVARADITTFTPLPSAHMLMTTEHYDSTQEWGGLSNVNVTANSVSFDISPPLGSNKIAFVANEIGTPSDRYKASAVGLFNGTARAPEIHKVEWKQVDSISIPYPIE